MLIYLLAFLGGVLTILSPCILPVLPFVFARADQPFRRSGLPLFLVACETKKEVDAHLCHVWDDLLLLSTHFRAVNLSQ
jgi:hypothetical protein